MKIIITESQYKMLLESNKNESMQNLKQEIKNFGIKDTAKLVNGFDNLMEILNIDSPMDFLNLFNDLESVQSEEQENFTLYSYKKGYNFMIYDRNFLYVYISYDDIWSVLEDKFGLNYSETQELTKTWLDEVYNLRGVTTIWGSPTTRWRLDEVYNLRGVTTTDLFGL